MSALEFVALHDSVPACKADAVVALSGDGTTRLDHAVKLIAYGWAPTLVVSGGFDNPPFSRTATNLCRSAIELGLTPERIVVEGESRNTREQAVNVTATACDRGWSSLVLVASSFHAWRAYLTFVRALKDAGAEERICLVPAPSRAPWFRSVDGVTRDRFTMLSDELAKIEQYAALGHVATWDEGVEYLRFWDSK